MAERQSKLSRQEKAQVKDRMRGFIMFLPNMVMMLGRMLKDRDKEKVARVTRAFLHMKKFDIAQLREAFEGNMVER